MDMWHSAEGSLDISSIQPGFHCGSIEQARMRRHNGSVYRLTLRDRPKTTIMKDLGSWCPKRITKAARRAQVAKYLNRYEGIDQQDLDAATLHADAPDAVFARKVPSSSHSWIILDPTIVLKIEKVS